VFARRQGVEEAPLSGELMLFDQAASKFFVLNRTMAFIWQRCDGRQTLTGMLDALDGEFAGVERGVAEHDFQRALEELVSLGLIVDAGSSPADRHP
jgi:hypothetical protein